MNLEPSARSEALARPTADEPVGTVHTSITLIVSLVLATALGPLAMSSFIPAIPSIQAGFGAPTTTAQLTLTVSILVMAVCSLFYGALADRHGRRPVLLGGVALAIVGSIVCATAPSVYVVIAGRGVQAAGATAGLVLSRVIVRDVYGDARAASVLAYVTAAMALAPLVGPIAGGYLIDYFDWRSVFVAVGVLAAMLWLLLWLQLPETIPRTGQKAGRSLMPAAQYGALLRRFTYLRYVVYGAMMQGTFMAFIAGAPHVAMNHFELSASAYGWHFMFAPIGYFVGSMIAGRFGNRWERERLLKVGGVLTLLICGFGFWLAFQAAFTAWGFFLPMAFLSAVIGVVFPSAQVALLSSAGEQSGVASGFFSFIQLAIGAGLAQLVGTLLDHGPAAVSGVMTAVAAAALAAVLVRPKRAAAAKTDASRRRVS
jgi:MFS transporter, DHA1 family, multidrug resistance protein